MICKTCRTEISDKALICYQCGEATTDESVLPRPRIIDQLFAFATGGTLTLVIGLCVLLLIKRIGDSVLSYSILIITGLVLAFLVRRTRAR